MRGRFSLALCALVSAAISMAASSAAAPPSGTAVATTTTVITLDGKAIQGDRLRFLGGIAIDVAERRFGGFTGLRWKKDRLVAVSNAGAWAEFVPTEVDTRLVGIGPARWGPLLGIDGRSLLGTDAGDAQALTADQTGWAVSFGQAQRLLHYRTIDGRPTPLRYPDIATHDGSGGNSNIGGLRAHGNFGGDASGEHPSVDVLRPIASDMDVTALATGGDDYMICARRPPALKGNCATLSYYGVAVFKVSAPSPLQSATPSDADLLDRAYLYMLTIVGNGATEPSVAFVTDDSKAPPLATFSAPRHAKFEGLAVRAEGRRRYLYVISDNALSPTEPTILLKFEVLAK